MCYGDYRFLFGGGSYSSVYVPPPMFVFPMVLIICIPPFFPSYCILYSHFLVYITPGFSFSNCVNLNHTWMKPFGGGVCICFSSYAAICAF